MKTLVDGRWTDGFLDYHRKPQECRIKVLACLTLTKIEELYFVRSGSARLLWNYIQEIGIRDVCRKVVSRRGERFRNENSCPLVWEPYSSPDAIQGLTTTI